MHGYNTCTLPFTWKLKWSQMKIAYKMTLSKDYFSHAHAKKIYLAIRVILKVAFGYKVGTGGYWA